MPYEEVKYDVKNKCPKRRGRVARGVICGGGVLVFDTSSFQSLPLRHLVVEKTANSLICVGRH